MSRRLYVQQRFLLCESNGSLAVAFFKLSRASSQPAPTPSLTPLPTPLPTPSPTPVPPTPAPTPACGDVVPDCSSCNATLCVECNSGYTVIDGGQSCVLLTPARTLVPTPAPVSGRCCEFGIDPFDALFAAAVHEHCLFAVASGLLTRLAQRPCWCVSNTGTGREEEMFVVWHDDDHLSQWCNAVCSLQWRYQLSSSMVRSREMCIGHAVRCFLNVIACP
jgi:hypothetical protein